MALLATHKHRGYQGGREGAGGLAPHLGLVRACVWLVCVSPRQDVRVISKVNGMIDDYLGQERTIILAVIPANQDIATIDILERAQKVGRGGGPPWRPALTQGCGLCLEAGYSLGSLMPACLSALLWLACWLDGCLSMCRWTRMGSARSAC